MHHTSGKNKNCIGSMDFRSVGGLTAESSVYFLPYLTEATIGAPVPLMTFVASDVTSLPTQGRGSITRNMFVTKMAEQAYLAS